MSFNRAIGAFFTAFAFTLGAAVPTAVPAFETDPFQLWYNLHDHPDGSMNPPGYGLRLDNVHGWDDFSWSFDTLSKGGMSIDPSERVMLHYNSDENGEETIRVMGKAFGGRYKVSGEDPMDDWDAYAIWEFDLLYTSWGAPVVALNQVKPDGTVISVPSPKSGVDGDDNAFTPEEGDMWELFVEDDWACETSGCPSDSLLVGGNLAHPTDGGEFVSMRVVNGSQKGDFAGVIDNDDFLTLRGKAMNDGSGSVFFFDKSQHRLNCESVGGSNNGGQHSEDDGAVVDADGMSMCDYNTGAGWVQVVASDVGGDQWAKDRNSSSTRDLLFKGKEKPGETPDTPGTEVPEPATLGLFGIALAGIGFVRRRRRTA